MVKTIHYTDYDCDMIQSPEQDYRLPKDFEWIRRGRGAAWMYRWNNLIYKLIAIGYNIFAGHIRTRNKSVFKSLGSKQGALIYGNHTLPAGDALSPAFAHIGRRNWVVCSPANFSIPVIGKRLDKLGALPIGEGRDALLKLSEAVSQRISEGAYVTIYPEAHLWPYCSFIRPFNEASFHYAVSNDAPVFSATTTFIKRKHGDKPRMTIYYDGPFYPDQQLPPKERRRQLALQVRDAMERRSKLSNYNHINYIQDGKE